jgi:hypothetical protein
VFHVGVFEHDEGIAAAEFHRRRLQVLARTRGDAAARGDAAGQGHALDPWVVDHAVGLLMRDQQIGIKPGGRAGILPQLLECDRALRDAACVFDHQHVAGHQMRSSDTGELIVGEVPRLDAENHADRAALHMCIADAGMELLRLQEAFGVLCVIGEDVGAEFHFAPRLADALAHLQRHGVGERFGAVVQNCARTGDDGGALGVAGEPPGPKAGFGCRELSLERVIGQIVEGPQDVAVEWIDALIGHGWTPCVDVAQECRTGFGGLGAASVASQS